MVSRITILGIGLVFAFSSFSYGAGGGSQDPETVNPDGLFTISPVLDHSCIAIKIPVGSTQALSGLKWFNNDGDIMFPKIKAAPGYTDVPPQLTSGILVAENVVGGEFGWGEVLFAQPIASQTGVLYIVFQLPANIEGDAVGEGPGFGYKMCDEPSSIFVSSDGDDWSRLATDYQLMVDPVYNSAKSNVIMLSMPSHEDETQWNRDREVEPLPEVAVHRTELLIPYPNPFNPSTTIAFTLRNSSRVKLDVYDIRGRLVKSLLGEVLGAGRHEVQWLGRNRHGGRVASGVYFARMRADDREEIKRMLLMK